MHLVTRIVTFSAHRRRCYKARSADNIENIGKKRNAVAAVSVGIYQGVPVLDLDYPEDSRAETDMNVIMSEQGGFIEVQGTAEVSPYSRQELDQMLSLAEGGVAQLLAIQRAALAR